MEYADIDLYLPSWGSWPFCTCVVRYWELLLPDWLDGFGGCDVMGWDVEDDHLEARRRDKE